jgi:adenylate cyclase
MLVRRPGAARGFFAMSFEIERKFLVVNDGWRASVIDSDVIRDGVVSEHNGAKVRVRLGRAGAWLTVKSDRSGPIRLEYEYEIPRSDAEEMLDRICDQHVFEKTRHKVEHAGNVWLIDIYDGRLSGIVLAEIELQSEDEYFESPDWIGQEVTYNTRFHKRTIGRLCREAGRPLSVVELLNDGSDLVDSCGAVSLAS